MLVVFTRAIIIYICLLFAMRLMGKKQLGELQPFEFAISLIVADLACIPMSDTAIPMTYGLAPIFTLFVLHLVVTKIVKHSIRLRGLINGHPLIVINSHGIDSSMLKKLDMTVSDLMESLRSAGYFSPMDVEYAIVETNGKLSVLPKMSPKQSADTDSTEQPSEVDPLPITLISEGKCLKSSLDYANLTLVDVEKILTYTRFKAKQILLMQLNGDSIYIQPLTQDAVCISRDEVLK